MAAEGWQQFDCYKVLGVHVAAAPAEIRKAYYRASRKAHPDRGGSHEGQVRVNLAFEVLSDPVTRQAHDLFWYRFRAPAGAGPEVPARPRPPAADAARPAAAEPLEMLLARVWEALGHDGTVFGPTPPSPSRARRAGTAVGPPAGQPAARDGRRDATAAAPSPRRDATAAAPSPRRDATAAAPSPRRDERHRRMAFAGASALSGLALGASLSDLALGGSLPVLHTLWLGAGAGWIAFTAAGFRRDRNGARPVLPGPAEGRAARRAEDARRAGAREVHDPRLAPYASGIAFLGELLIRPTELDDSEDQLARRITAALFVMGYKPLGYDRRYRLLLFTDDEERLLIRFRHRAGAAINVTFVQGMVEAMDYTGATKGILFCSTGLSGNGAALASQRGIRWYTLARMNEWIESVIRARYTGPPGDILVLLEQIVTFVRQLSTPLPTQRAARRGAAG
jgi:curved DNA-binding protein CbpA